MIDPIYKGIGRVGDTQAYELQTKLKMLSLEGQDDDGSLIWAGHQDTFVEVDRIIDYYEEHGQFPTDPDEEAEKQGDMERGN